MSKCLNVHSAIGRIHRRESIREHCRGHRTMGAVSWRRKRTVLNMLDEIGSVENIPEYVRRAKDKDDRSELWDSVRAINYDPRAGHAADLSRSIGKWVCKTIPYWRWRKNSNALRWKTSTLLKNSCIRTSTSIQALF